MKLDTDVTADQTVTLSNSTRRFTGTQMHSVLL